MKRDFLTLRDLSCDELLELLERAIALKDRRARGVRDEPMLDNRTVALVFEKASTRTRVSFEVAVRELGGAPIHLSTFGSQLGRGEPIEDTARVLGGYCHGVALRTFSHQRIEDLARWCPAPVINALTDDFHPCQLLADLVTVKERHGTLRGLRYAWIGDGNNMANSWINAAAMLGLDLVLACPPKYKPKADVVARAQEDLRRLGAGSVDVVDSPKQAASGAHVVSCDVWASMGQEEEAEARRQAFAGYLVDDALLSGAADNAIVLHCLPAHRGEEISAEVLEGPKSAVWAQAENRLHAQKALLEVLYAMLSPSS